MSRAVLRQAEQWPLRCAAGPEDYSHIHPPADEYDPLAYLVDSSWQSNGFDATKDLVRGAGQRALDNGYTGPPEGVTGWRLTQLMHSMGKNPQRDDILGGELVARAVHGQPTTVPLWRGTAHTPEHLDTLREGGTIGLPLSSFTSDYGTAKRFAQPSEENWQSGDRPPNGVPVVYRLEPGAKVAPIWNKNADDPLHTDEHVGFGEFDIVKVAPDTSWHHDGPTEITLRQKSLRPKSVWPHGQ